MAASAQIRCVDAARAGARAAARSEPEAQVLAVARSAAPDRARVDLERAGELWRVRVDAPAPGLGPLDPDAERAGGSAGRGHGGGGAVTRKGAGAQQAAPRRAWWMWCVRRHRRRGERDRGVATVWVAMTTATLCAVFAVVLALGQAVAARHRAGGAADLAALAAADRALQGTAGGVPGGRGGGHGAGGGLVRCALCRGRSPMSTARVRFGPTRRWSGRGRALRGLQPSGPGPLRGRACGSAGPAGSLRVRLGRS